MNYITEASPASPPSNKGQSSALNGLLVAQFFGAFNDNAWKLIVALLAIKQAAASAGISGPDFEVASQAKTTQAFVIFTLPLMVVSAFSGVFSDRFSKRTVIVVMKAVEVLLMGAGTAALFLHPLGGVLPLLVLAGMGAHSALFSPSKYGILPELLPHHRLSWGNGQLEMWTFIAIIAGTALAGPMLDLSGQTTWLAGLVLMLCSGIGLWASMYIPSVPRARHEGGVRETWHAAIEALQSDRVLKLGVLGSMAFWTLASLVGQDVLIYAKAVLQLSDSLSGLPLAAFGVGVGIGAMLAGKLSAAKVELGFLPLGGIGITLSLFALGFGTPQLRGTLLAMACLGLASGFVVVPLNALIQWRSPADRRGAVIAFANTLVFGGVLLGSLGSGFLAKIGLSASHIFIVSGHRERSSHLWGDPGAPRNLYSVDARGVYPYHLSTHHQWTGSYSPGRRGAPGAQSRLLHRRPAPARHHGPSHSISRGPILLRPSLAQSLCQNHGSDSGLIERNAKGNLTRAYAKRETVLTEENSFVFFQKGKLPVQAISCPSVRDSPVLSKAGMSPSFPSILTGSGEVSSASSADDF